MTLVATMTKMGPKAVYGALGAAGIFAGILSTIQSVNGEFSRSTVGNCRFCLLF